MSLLQLCFGLEFEPDAWQISLNEPRLWSFLDEVTERHLLIGSGSADIAIRRSGRNVVVDVIERAISAGSRPHDRLGGQAPATSFVLLFLVGGEQID